MNNTDDKITKLKEKIEDIENKKLNESKPKKKVEQDLPLK